MTTVKARKFASDICELFEDLLDEHNITIPDEDDYSRDPENEARLYGMTYAELEDSVMDVLFQFASEIDRDCKVEILDEY